MENIEAIIDQLNSCGVCPSCAVSHAMKKDTSLGSCCPVAIGNALKDMYDEIQSIVKQTKTEIEENEENTEYEECPECGKRGLTHIGGCDECVYCGYSKCS